MEAVANKSKKELAYDAIKDMLLSGKINSNTPISERQLCQELDVSRTPVREALQALANDGLLDIIEGKGVVRSKVNMRDLIELYELRLCLECMAVNLFVERATDDNIRELRRIYDKAQASLSAGDNAAFMEYDMDFHHYIAAESKNKKLCQTITNNYAQIQIMAISVEDDPQLCKLASENHGEVMEAIENRDKAAALKGMEDHINQMKQYHQNRYYLFE